MKSQSDLLFFLINLLKLCSITSLMIVLVACEDKKLAQQETAAPTSIELPVEKNVKVSIEKVSLQLPSCKETYCPQIQIYRLNSNEPKLNEICDQYIIKYIDDMITTFDIKSLQYLIAQPKVTEDSPITSLIKIEQTKAKINPTPMQDDKNQDFIKILQPNINRFVYLADEISALGARSQLNLYIKPKLISVNDSIVTVLIDASHYMGGAHGATSQQYINFDLEDQRLLNLETIIKRDQMSQFNKVIYENFKYWISDVDETLDAQTYESLWPFKVSENFYLDKDSLILQYGQYELGPYAIGLPRLEIPYKDLATVLDPHYLPAQFQK